MATGLAIAGLCIIFTQKILRKKLSHSQIFTWRKKPMPVNLEIPDGNPWWLSPNIWTVPGNDPAGPSGTPIAGEPCYVWARVTNKGNTGVANASVRFYWANPAVGFNRNTANHIGTSFVTLNAGETADVLSLTPWIPEFVNEGHECILAEAFHPSLDPLPATPEFNVSTDRHVAQRNISVLLALKNFFRLAFTVHNTERIARNFRLAVNLGKLGQIEPLLKRLGQDLKLPSREGKTQRLGFVRIPCPDEDDLEKASREIFVEVKPEQRIGFSLIGRLETGFALVHVEQFADNLLVGGLSALIIADENNEECSLWRKLLRRFN